MSVPISTARLEARISTDLHAMLKRAADIQGRTVTDFVVAAVRQAAHQAIEQSEVIRLTLAPIRSALRMRYWRRRSPRPH